MEQVAIENKNAVNAKMPIPQPPSENLPAEMSGSWGAEGVDAHDIVIPRLLLMQGLSDFVKQRIGLVAGDIVHSTTKKKLGDDKKGVPIIPIMLAAKIWIVDEELTPGTWTFKERVAWSIQNSNWESKEQRLCLVNGVNTRRTLCLDYFVISPEYMDGLPFLLSFRKTSFNTGKQMSTYFTECQMKKVPPASKVFSLSCHEKVKGDKTWFVFNFVEERASTKEELATAYKWYQTLKTSKVKVDEDEDVAKEPGEDQVPF
jgi:hypothetical protein